MSVTDRETLLEQSLRDILSALMTADYDDGNHPFIENIMDEIRETLAEDEDED
jgi:hypothetical protein